MILSTLLKVHQNVFLTMHIMFNIKRLRAFLMKIMEFILSHEHSVAFIVLNKVLKLNQLYHFS